VWDREGDDEDREQDGLVRVGEDEPDDAFDGFQWRRDVVEEGPEMLVGP
jgi:hypothetical protein